MLFILRISRRTSSISENLADEDKPLMHDALWMCSVRKTVIHSGMLAVLLCKYGVCYNVPERGDL